MLLYLLFISSSARDTTWSACTKAWLRLVMISLYLWTSSMLSSVSLSPASLWSTWILLRSATLGSRSSSLVKLPTSKLGFSFSTRAEKFYFIHPSSNFSFICTNLTTPGSP